jgi:hypothetical protein
LTRARLARALCAALSLGAAGALFAGGIAGASGATGAISGHVSSSSEDPVCVLVLDGEGQAIASGASTANGNYTVESVPPGNWTVEFIPDEGCAGVETGQAFQFYSDQSTRYTASQVTVIAGQTTTGIDAQLVLAAKITGTVGEPAGKPLFGVCVVLDDTSGRQVLRQLTNPAGEYSLSQLPPGGYLVQFLDEGCVGASPSFAPQFYPGVSELASATEIMLTPDDTVNGIDATLQPLPPSVSGPPGSSVPPTGNRPAGEGTGRQIARTHPRPHPRGLRVSVSPRHARRAPFLFTITGRLLLPRGVGHTAGCRGAIEARALVGRSVVGLANTHLGHACRFRLRIRLQPHKPGVPGRARLLVSFAGNALVSGSSTHALVVRFGGGEPSRPG